MVQSLAAIAILAILAILGTSAVALPAFAPSVEAGESVALAKGDRLQVRSSLIDCSHQTWPELGSSCLRNSDPAAPVLVTRVVMIRR